MARKSRRNTYVENKVTDYYKPNFNLFKTGIYIRLSVEKDTNDTIENQIKYCKKYVLENSELDLIDIYVDNGISGTVFDRPEFNRLVTDFNSGKINCIICKDLSRFGRDYIETGIYLERILPKLNIRFIAINEQYDSFTTDRTNEALMIPLQNMINSLYAKDISRKVSTTLRASMKNGTFKQPVLAYGYKYDEHNKVVIDYAVSDYVHIIFKHKLDGKSLHEIKTILENLNALTPSMYRLSQTNNYELTDIKKKYWDTSTINKILKNQFYIGDTVWGQSITALYKGEKCYKVHNKEDMFIFENTHPPIVSRADFQLVSQIFEKSSKIKNDKMKLTEKQRKQIEDLFIGKIFCGDCGNKMYFKRNKSYRKNDIDNIDKIDKIKIIPIYVCSTATKKQYKKGGAECSYHRINRDELNNYVLSSIQMHSKMAIDYEKLIVIMKEKNKEKDLIKRHSDNIASLKLKLNGVNKRRKRLYNDFSNGILTENEYLFAKDEFNIEYDNLNILIEESTRKQIEFNEALSSENKWINLMKSVRTLKYLNKELVDTTVEKIFIYENKKVEIIMKFDDIFKATVDIIKNIESEKNL